MVSKGRRYKRIDRKEYILKLLKIPETRGADLVQAATAKLPELYPGEISACRWDYRLLGPGGRDQLLVAIIPTSSVSPPGLYLPLFHAVDVKLHRKETGVTLSESGITDILITNSEGSYSLRQHQGSDDIGSADLDVLRRRRGYRGAFKERTGIHSVLKTGLVVLIATSLLFVLGRREIQKRYTELSKLAGLRREQTVQLEELSALQEEAEAINPCVSDASPPLSILALIELLATAVAEGSRLVRLEYTPAYTVVEIEGPDALLSLERLRDLSGVDVSLLGEIRPLPDNPQREEYRLQLVIEE